MKTIYKAEEMAKMLNVSIKTIQRWDREGVLKAKRTPTNRRYYTHEQYESFLKIEKGEDNEKKRKVVIYTRVSNRKQKGDLENQVLFLQQFTNEKGIIVDEVIEDIGSGLNYNRKKWNDLLEKVWSGEVSDIYISHKDRFIRFGFDWFEKMCNKHHTNIIVVNNEKLSPQEELVQDLISIIHVFSCRMHGLRKYKKKIKEDESCTPTKSKFNQQNDKNS